jgi:hypothetical protein
LMVAKSLNLRLANTDPDSLCVVTQLVTGQVRCHVTGMKPTSSVLRLCPSHSRTISRT